MNLNAQIPYKYVQVLCTIGNTCVCKLDSECVCETIVFVCMQC